MKWLEQRGAARLEQPGLVVWRGGARVGWSGEGGADGAMRRGPKVAAVATGIAERGAVEVGWLEWRGCRGPGRATGATRMTRRGTVQMCGGSDWVKRSAARTEWLPRLGLHDVAQVERRE